MEPTGQLTRGSRLPKAGREQVLAAADAILLAGQRPTIETIQARLGGGSPNSIVSYLRDWYRTLGERLAVANTPAEGLAPEVHQAALTLQRSLLRSPTSAGIASDSTEALIRSLRADSKSLQLLVDELRGQRGRDQQALADARALLLRKDEELRLQQESQAGLRIEVAKLRQRLEILTTSMDGITARRRKNAEVATKPKTTKKGGVKSSAGTKKAPKKANKKRLRWKATVRRTRKK